MEAAGSPREALHRLLSFQEAGFGMSRSVWVLRVGSRLKCIGICASGCGCGSSAGTLYPGWGSDRERRSERERERENANRVQGVLFLYDMLDFYPFTLRSKTCRLKIAAR